MTHRQTQLIKAYARTGSVHEAAEAAFYTGKHIRKVLQTLLETNEGQAVYNAEVAKRQPAGEAPQRTWPDLTDATPEEIKRHLTTFFNRVMAGVLPGSSDMVSVAQRTRAAENLAKLNGLFKEIEFEQAGPVFIREGEMSA